MSASTPVSGRLIVERMMNEPVTSTMPMSTNSGPWCAASEMSKRSETSRLMRSPDLLWSKKLKLMRS